MRSVASHSPGAASYRHRQMSHTSRTNCRRRMRHLFPSCGCRPWSAREKGRRTDQGWEHSGWRLDRTNAGAMPDQPHTKAAPRPALHRPCTGVAPALPRMFPEPARSSPQYRHPHALDRPARSDFARSTLGMAAPLRSRNVAHSGSKLLCFKASDRSPKKAWRPCPKGVSSFVIPWTPVPIIL